MSHFKILGAKTMTRGMFRMGHLLILHTHASTYIFYNEIKRVLCEVRTAYVYIMCKCMAVERHYDGY